MKKKKIKEFCGMNNVTEYIESLDENTTIISHTVNGMFHYISTEKEVIEPRKPYVNEQLVERVSEWCTKHNVEYRPSEGSFMSVKDMLEDFNKWNNSNMNSQTFISVFERVGEMANNFPEQIVEKVDGALYYGFKGITIGGKRTKAI